MLSAISDVVLRLRCRLWDRQLPKQIVVKDFDRSGVTFEASGAAELRRIVYNGFEQEYVGRMLDVLEPSDILFDIGANIGLVALHGAGLSDRVVAFEPDPEFNARLTRNAGLNPNSHLTILPYAIGDQNGTMTLFTDGAQGTSPSLIRQRGERDTTEVAVRTLDELVSTGELPTPTVLKLDIEGAEILALRGAKALLNGPTPPRLLLIEVHGELLGGFGSSGAEVRGLLSAAGYDDVVYEAGRAEEQHLILGRRSQPSTAGS